MAKFVLAREGKGGVRSLPGTPVAIVRSKNAEHDKLFLCTVDDADTEEDVEPASAAGAGADAKKKTGSGDADKDGRHNPYKGGTLGIEPSKTRTGRGSSRSRSPDRKGKPPPVRDLDDAVFGVPSALRSAAKFADETDIPSALGDGALKGRGVSDTKSAAKAAAIAADEKARFTAKRDTVVLPPGSSFEQLTPTDGSRIVQFVGGRSGSGKSHKSAGLIKIYQKLNPGAPVFGVCKTKLKDDDVYAPLGIKQLPISAFYSSGKLDVKALFGDKGCLVLFDDWDSFEGEELETVLAAIKDIINLGRKMNISIIVTSHMLSDYNKTRNILREATFLTFFPEHEQAGAMEYTCKKTLGLKPDVVEEMGHLGRSVTLHNTRPKFILAKNKAFMI